MNPFKYLKNPHLVTKAILRWMRRLGRLAILEFSRYNVKKLSEKILGIRPQDIDQLPRRYLFFTYGFSVLGTVHFWGFIGAVISGNWLSGLYFSFFISLYYGLALFVVRIYPRGFFNTLMNYVYGVVGFFTRLVEAIRETRE